MRRMQIAFFALGVLSFLAAAALTGNMLGDVFWRAGVAVMLGDIVLALIWPRKEAAPGARYRAPPEGRP